MARPLPIRPQLLHPPPDESESVPFTISGLIGAWFADDLRASLADAAAVSSWADASGNGNTLSNTGTNRPTFDYTNPQFNGHASVNFTKGSTHYLFGSSLPICTALSGADKPHTIFVVARRSTKVSADEAAVCLGNSGSGTASAMTCRWRYASSNSQRPAWLATDDVPASATLSGTNEITDMSSQVLVWSLSGTTANGFVIGATQNPEVDALVNNLTTTDYSALGTFTFNRFALGASVRSTVTLPATMEVACVLVYNRELSQLERSRICQHLWNKYIPRVITAPSSLTGLAHHWDASLLPEAEAAAVSTFTASTGGKNFTSAGAARPVVVVTESGNKALRFDGTDDTMAAGAVADWKFLNDGSDFSIFVVYRVASGDEGLYPVLDTLGGNVSTGTGLGLYHNGASAAHSFQYKVGASTGDTTEPLDEATQNYGARPDAWHVAHLTHEGTLPSTEEPYHAWMDNEHFNARAVASVAARANTNPTATLTLGSYGTTFGKVDIAEIIIYTRKLGPSESQLVNEYLARKWQTAHAAVAAGNGLANVLNDTNKHRGFPALCRDQNGTWHCVYRKGPDHGASRGVGVQVTSADGIRWSPEKVIYNVDDADGRDFRGECGFIRLTQGTHAGRLLLFSKWSTDASAIEVTGFPSTLLIGYSDDNGGSWTWLDPMASDPIVTSTTTQLPVKYTASPNGLIELSTGRIVMTFSASDKDEAGTSNQDIRLSYSDDGGLTWSDSVVVLSHDSIAWRATETHILEWDDGALTMFVRNDTDKEIWRLTATISDLTSWSLDGAKLFDGYGRPMAIRDPNDAESCYIIYRSDPGVVTVWRHSADRGATWAAERAFSNLHSTTTIAAHGEMSYSYAAADADGNIWVASGLEEQDDSDVFVRRWINAE